MRLVPAANTAPSTRTLFALLTAFSITTASLPTLAGATSVVSSRSLSPRGVSPLSIASTGALLLSTTPSFASASQPIIPASQRNFRIGRPAASIQTMSSSTSLPPQTTSFAGFESHPNIEPSGPTATLIKDAVDLFSAKPSPQIFARSWSPSAIFADPICHANGSRQYLAQWYGMPAAFSESQLLEWKLIKDEPKLVEYVQKQRYKVKGLGMVKEMISTVVMERDGEGKVVRFEDRWNHKPLGGVLGWPFRRANALVLPWIVGVPGETKQAVGKEL